MGASVSAAVGADNSKKKESQLKGAKQAAHQDTNKAAAAAKQPRPGAASFTDALAGNVSHCCGSRHGLHCKSSRDC